MGYDINFGAERSLRNFGRHIERLGTLGKPLKNFEKLWGVGNFSGAIRRLFSWARLTDVFQSNKCLFFPAVSTEEEVETANDETLDINSLLEEEVIENALIEVKPGLFYQDLNSTEKPILDPEDQTNLPTNDHSSEEEIINEIGKLTEFLLDPSTPSKTTSQIQPVSTYESMFRDPNYRFTYKCKECTFETSESDDITTHTLKVHHAVGVSH